MRAFAIVTTLLIAAIGTADAQTRQPRTDIELRATYAPLVEATAPAVVNIFTSRTVQTRSVFDDPFFSQFFGQRPGGRTRQQTSLGSGVILASDGIIVTNNHVIDGMDEIKVVLADRREFEATLLLADEQTDLAILKVETPDPLPTLRFADSDEAKVGDIVLAIGNPFGVGQTVTSGIVSALSRTNVSMSDFQFFIQTDAAINPGNSGGALIDVDGNLLGVNTAIYSRSGGSNGVGFAIPGSVVQRVLASAVGGETVVRRPWIGVLGSDVNASIATALGLDRPRGALINRLFDGGPAERAGLEEGDVILSIAGQDVQDADALRYRPATREVGETVEIRYLREGKERRSRVKLALPPEDPKRDLTLLRGEHILTGVTIANLSPALNEELGRNPFDRGVVVTSLDRRVVNRRVPVREQYLILDINGEAMETVGDVQRAVKKGVQTITVRNTRGRTSTYRIR
ncbi:Do family serine endopeptidase [Parvularcula sp. ZS-1/3]|uniref:Do family serine endopeptidase n=1 Tax=Parvularcula mediterranea TaxID=2732508 RepID=A0A7Y3RIT9_9PROT|nr:Do family serine endopeptidase [Parvularcula mediterranea]NNU14863.1 Do family serine endopeptidase [Parvularcula mediterranea]